MYKSTVLRYLYTISNDTHLDLRHLREQHILISPQNVQAVCGQTESKIGVQKVDQDCPHLVGVPGYLEVPGEVVKERLCGRTGKEGATSVPWSSV